ncbi:hypothetical protein LPIBR_20265 [Lacticaseibacillus paracasei]|nr:hypothetical protein LPIBR_20265 [Lacticaseibacillus paracasei]
MQKYCGIDNFATFTSSVFKLVYDRQGIDKIPNFVYVALEINPHYHNLISCYLLHSFFEWA